MFCFLFVSLFVPLFVSDQFLISWWLTNCKNGKSWKYEYCCMNSCILLFSWPDPMTSENHSTPRNTTAPGTSKTQHKPITTSTCKELWCCFWYLTSLYCVDMDCVTIPHADVILGAAAALIIIIMIVVLVVIILGRLRPLQTPHKSLNIERSTPSTSRQK